jgi:hypothetical protein
MKSSFTSFLLLLFKGAFLNHLGFSFSEHNFWLEFWKNLFLQLSLGGKEWLILINGGNKDNRLDDCGTFERMEVSKDSFRNLKS